MDYNNDIEIKINDQIMHVNPLMIFISNSNELGYKVSLTPQASLQDGLLDVLIVTKLNAFKIALFSFLAIFNKHHILKEVKKFQTKHIKLSQAKKQPFYSQIDGEILELNDEHITISISEKSLNVIAN